MADREAKQIGHILVGHFLAALKFTERHAANMATKLFSVKPNFSLASNFDVCECVDMSNDPHADDDIFSGRNEYERDAIAADLEWLDKERALFLDTVNAAAQRLAIGARERRPEWLQCWSFATRAQTESPDEVAQGFVEQVAACVNDLTCDLFDHDALEGASEEARKP